jgi:hypothetical protein
MTSEEISINCLEQEAVREMVRWAERWAFCVCSAVHRVALRHHPHRGSFLAEKEYGWPERGTTLVRQI